MRSQFPATPPLGQLARPLARTMAVIGNGAQSEFQILAFRALLGINEVRVFDIDQAATGK